MSPTSAAELGLRFRAVADLFKDRKAAARAAGVSVEQLGRYMRGDSEPGLLASTRICAAKGVDLNWLTTGVGGMMIDMEVLARRAFADDQVPYSGAGASGEFFPVPRYDVRASAGPGAVADGAGIKDNLMFRVDWIRRELATDPAKLGCMDLIGDSMEPLIPNGATILFDRAVERIAADGIYVVGLEDALLVKRVQRLMGGLVLLSENPRYPPMTLDTDQAARLEVKGRVRWFGRMI